MSTSLFNKQIRSLIKLHNLGIGLHGPLVVNSTHLGSSLVQSVVHHSNLVLGVLHFVFCSLTPEVPIQQLLQLLLGLFSLPLSLLFFLESVRQSEQLFVALAGARAGTLRHF